MLLAALNEVVAASQDKLGDVARYAERWKRLGERLHPHEYDQWPHAQEVFAVARGERRVHNLAGRAEAAIRAGAIGPAASVLSAAPGLLLRSADRLLRLASPPERTDVVDAVTGALGSASGRVLLLAAGACRQPADARVRPDVCEPLAHRVGRSRRATTAAGRAGGRVVVAARRARSAPGCRSRDRPLLVDPEVLDVALPLSGKATEGGFAVLPRGSRASVSGELLRFFTYWRQTSRRTDYDLSVLLLDDEFHSAGQVSWTNYHHDGVVHSGDITDATNGATEFIDVPLTVRGHYVVPQVNIYCGRVVRRGRRVDVRLPDPQRGTSAARRSTRGPSGRVRTCAARAASRCRWCSPRASVAGRRCGCTCTCGAGRLQPGGGEHVRHGRPGTGPLMERRYLTVSYLVDRWRARTEVTDVERPAAGRAGHVHRHRGARGPAGRIGDIFTGSAQ